MCAGGSCACGEDLVLCDGACVDTDADPSNCGGCGTSCPGEMICEAGACGCPAGTSLCDGACIDTTSDLANCGGCGNMCGRRQVCSDSACACAEGLTLCGGECVDTLSDGDHCGGCGAVCTAGGGASAASCEDGSCVHRCLPDFATCEEGSAGCESDLRTSNAHCGTCGTSCEDLPNTATSQCTDGGCAISCAEGWGDCDLQPANGCEKDLSRVEACGSCAVDCTALFQTDWQFCIDGACEFSACMPGFDDCDGVVSNGCEADLTEGANCGACGNSCPIGCGGASCLQLVDVFGSNERHSCGVIDDGRVFCWGDDTHGQVGTGTTGNNRHVPVEVVLPLAASQVTGGRHSCALLIDGTVSCWGGNDAGQLGDGGYVANLVPTVVPGVAGASQIAANSDFTCALGPSGIKCWGNNVNGQLGCGLPGGPQPTAVDVVDSAGAKQVVAGGMHACAIMADDSVSCWGQNNWGQLGTGDNLGSRVPVATGVTAAAHIAAGFGHACAVRPAGTVACWGWNQFLQLGSSGGASSTPTDVAGVMGATRVAAGFGHSCALLADGTATCWGDNTSGQLGDGNYASSVTPVAVLNLSGIQALTAGAYHSCASTGDTGWCWGSNTNGEVGGDSTLVTVRIPQRILF